MDRIFYVCKACYLSRYQNNRSLFSPWRFPANRPVPEGISGILVGFVVGFPSNTGSAGDLRTALFFRFLGAFEVAGIFITLERDLASEMMQGVAPVAASKPVCSTNGVFLLGFPCRGISFSDLESPWVLSVEMSRWFLPFKGFSRLDEKPLGQSQTSSKQG